MCKQKNIFIVFTLVVLLPLFACKLGYFDQAGKEEGESSATTPELQLTSVTNQVATPELSLDSGTYPAGTVIDITTATQGAEIYYVVVDDDGQELGDKVLYNPADDQPEDKPEIAPETGTVNLSVYASKAGMMDSEKVVKTYTVKVD